MFSNLQAKVFIALFCLDFSVLVRTIEGLG
jgi:hypothetical protein